MEQNMKAPIERQRKKGELELQQTKLEIRGVELINANS